jgi:hypothetical protein
MATKKAAHKAKRFTINPPVPEAELGVSGLHLTMSARMFEAPFD